MCFQLRCQSYMCTFPSSACSCDACRRPLFLWRDAVVLEDAAAGRFCFVPLTCKIKFNVLIRICWAPSISSPQKGTSVVVSVIDLKPIKFRISVNERVESSVWWEEPPSGGRSLTASSLSPTERSNLHLSECKSFYFCDFDVFCILVVWMLLVSCLLICSDHLLLIISSDQRDGD